MPGPAPPVVNGLQIDQSLDFQRRFHRVQTITWRVLALLPILAVAGLFGGGLFSEVSAGGPGAQVSYDRFGRLTVDTDVEVEVRSARQPAVVTLDRRFLDGYSVSEIRPQPERVTARADQTSFAFSALPGARVSFTVQPQRIGSARGTVAVAGARPVQVHQFVYP